MELDDHSLEVLENLFLGDTIEAGRGAVACYLAKIRNSHSMFSDYHLC